MKLDEEIHTMLLSDTTFQFLSEDVVIIKSIKILCKIDIIEEIL